MVLTLHINAKAVNFPTDENSRTKSLEIILWDLVHTLLYKLVIKSRAIHWTSGGDHGSSNDYFFFLNKIYTDMVLNLHRNIDKWLWHRRSPSRIYLEFSLRLWFRKFWGLADIPQFGKLIQFPWHFETSVLGTYANDQNFCLKYQLALKSEIVTVRCSFGVT